MEISERPDLQAHGMSPQDAAAAAYRLLLQREIDDGARAALAAASPDALSLAFMLLCSPEFMDKTLQRAIDVHSFLIHRARQIMVRRLLPPATDILDLGGANSPLYSFGYAHPFERMVMLDLPPEGRHEMYRNARVAIPHDCGNVAVHYGDMTDLGAFGDESFDLVWSGQSIEHVDRESGSRMLREAFRVLRPGGHVCLDTPNRSVTIIQTAGLGKGFIHGDHKYEYRAAELRALLRDTGFCIVRECGVCEMPRTVESGTFEYGDFVLGNPLSESPERGYILFFCGRKPAGDAR